MKADNSFETTGHNRTVKITGIPTDHPSDPSELTITINYVRNPGDDIGRVHMAVALDKHVIPAIIRAINGIDP